MKTTELYQQRLSEWEEEKKTNPDAERPGPEDVAEDLLSEALFQFRPGAAPDSVEVKLNCGEKPFATNGKWDEDTAAVSWAENPGEHQALPSVCFASWSSADCPRQKKHFGKVVLQGKDLAQYVLWYGSLGREEAEQWDRFLGGCKPGDRLKRRIEAFRFAADPRPDPDKPDEKPASLADTPRGLILEGLKEGEE